MSQTPHRTRFCVRWLAFTLAALLTGTIASTALSGVATAKTASVPVSGGPCYLNLCLYDAPADGSLTAFSLWDVGPSPYYISIFNVTTGARLALCGTGTSCTTGPYQFPPLNRCFDYVAFIGGFGTSIPPAPVQRTSATLTRCNFLH